MECLHYNVQSGIVSNGGRYPVLRWTIVGGLC